MGICQRCHGPAHTEWGNEGCFCTDCYDKIKQEKILQKYDKENITSSVDLRKNNWSAESISELFWIHLGIYQKHPNRKSLNVMFCARSWAAHSDHALSNSIAHALKWCGVNLIAEYKKDLPDDYKEE